MDSFLIKPKTYFGSNALDALNNHIEGKFVFVVTDKMMVQFGFAQQVCQLLERKNVRYSLFDDVVPDPDISTIVKGMKVMDQHFPDVIVALGGGSVIDAAKAIMYSLACFDAQRGQGEKQKPYFIAIPTTSGTGSEVTAFSVIKAKSEKLVVVDESILPDAAILDPIFVKSVPPKVTADTGIDVLCHSFEAYVSTKASDFSDALAEKAVKLVFDYLVTCYRDGNNMLAREKMHNASCIAGMAFTNASLGINHSLAHALGGAFGIPHGRSNALFMTHVIAFNADFNGACDNRAAKRYAQLAKILGLPCENARQGVKSLMTAVSVLKAELQIPTTIKDAGVVDADYVRHVDAMAAQAFKDNCTPTNPRAVTEYELKNLYLNAYQSE